MSLHFNGATLQRKFGQARDDIKFARFETHVVLMGQRILYLRHLHFLGDLRLDIRPLV